MKSRYLVCYDITRPKRLRKVYQFLKKDGIPIQYSVFLIQVNHSGLEKVKEELKKRIHPKFDDVRIYPLPSEPKERVFGAGTRLPRGIPFFHE